MDSIRDFIQKLKQKAISENEVMMVEAMELMALHIERQEEDIEKLQGEIYKLMEIISNSLSA